MTPFGFQWHITDRCNLRCSHCYQHSFTPDSERSFGELRQMADRIFAALGDRAVSINLTGGEPLLFPRLFDLIAHLETYPTLEEINLITNGTRAGDEVVAALRGCDKLGCLKLSLESTDAGRNDALRGTGNLARVTENIERLQRAEIPIVLMATLGSSNVGDIEAIVEWARTRTLSGIIFERFVPLGRGRKLADQVLTSRQWRRAVAAIANISGEPVGLDELLQYRAYWLSIDAGKLGELRGAACNLGNEAMALMPDGTVYPCRRLPIALGNVLDEPFEVLLERLAGYSVAALRPRLTGDLCGRCAIPSCAGCRALAYALTGDLLADDPQCYF